METRKAVIENVEHFVKDGYVACNPALNNKSWGTTEKISDCIECSKILNNQILETMSKNVLEVISISKIDLSVTNPRKTFDHKSLAELAQSIKEHGILQPVLVRPYVEGCSWEDYQLVCGERRYRAAILAGLEEIPANVRVLTDDEAFELQIIENLERKDVHPLDEADAFKKMLDSGKYTITDIAAKMAKPESFIVQRLKLVDLVEVLRDDFLAGHFGIGHAILMARCDEFKQFDIYQDAQRNNNEDPYYGTVKDIRETIEVDSYLLTEAKFDLNDAKLTDACACAVCPKRSGANPVLFEDMQEDRCFDQKCFDEKHEAFVEKEVAKIISEGQNVKIISAYGHISEMIVTMCKQYDVAILKMYSDYTTYEKDELEKAKGFYVSGLNKGNYIDIWLYKNESDTNAEVPKLKTPMSVEEIEFKESIAKIESRQTRALELDAEKSWAEMRVIDTSALQDSAMGLNDTEINAFAFALHQKLSWKTQKDYPIENFNFNNLSEINKLMRLFYIENLPQSYGSHLSSKNNNLYYKVLWENSHPSVKEIEDRIQAAADKRIEKQNSKIKELKAKIESIKPIEPEVTIEEAGAIAKRIKSNAKKAK